VIHCRPPSFDETRSPDAARTLGAVVRGALGRASEEGARSIAIASLGTGAYGFPAHVAAPSSLAEVALWLSRSRGSALARIVVFGPGMLTAYAEAAMRVLPSFVPVPLATGGLSVEIPRDASR
jgi:O-acetyl-ADP-ribose deacetylase (regulator of RNase III)